MPGRFSLNQRGGRRYSGEVGTQAFQQERQRTSTDMPAGVCVLKNQSWILVSSPSSSLRSRSAMIRVSRKLVNVHQPLRIATQDSGRPRNGKDGVAGASASFIWNSIFAISPPL